MKEEIRPIYAELQGYLAQAPKKESGYIFESALWEQVNNTIDELNEISKLDYNKFKLTPKSTNWNGAYEPTVNANDFSLKLNGLINNIYGKFFSEENAPFSSIPGTNIQMNQQQNQSTQIQILLEIQSILDRKINEVTDPNEKSFLEKVKSSLSSIKNVSELLKLILSTGSSMGLTIDQVLNIFK